MIAKATTTHHTLRDRCCCYCYCCCCCCCCCDYQEAKDEIFVKLALHEVITTTTAAADHLIIEDTDGHARRWMSQVRSSIQKARHFTALILTSEIMCEHSIVLYFRITPCLPPSCTLCFHLAAASSWAAKLQNIFLKVFFLGFFWKLSKSEKAKGVRTSCCWRAEKAVAMAPCREDRIWGNSAARSLSYFGDFDRAACCVVLRSECCAWPTSIAR